MPLTKRELINRILIYIYILNIKYLLKPVYVENRLIPPSRRMDFHFQ